MASKKIGLWDLVFMNISALFGIRWIAKSTASSFGLGLGAIPSWGSICIYIFRSLRVDLCRIGIYLSS